ncbi:MAG: alpha-2-macroglobulin family protein [Planctomycetota bacterium]
MPTLHRRSTGILCLETDDNGFAKIAFDLSDAVTTFRVLVDGHDLTGRLGSGTGAIVSRVPLSVEPKTPVELAVGDRMEMPVAIASDTTKPLNVRVEAQAMEPLSEQGPRIRELQVDPDARRRVYFLFEAKRPGPADVMLLALASSRPTDHLANEDALAQQLAVPLPPPAAAADMASNKAFSPSARSSGETRRRQMVEAAPPLPEAAAAEKENLALVPEFQDAIHRPMRVVPAGDLVEKAYSGVLEGEQELTITIPAKEVASHLEIQFDLYLSTLADLMAGLESILREPTGCFEQASSSNYPNVLALRFLQQQSQADPEIIRRAKQLLESGYQRITSFECPSGGFEWFGHDPGHEALTAYGLLQFHDMAKVHPVDEQMRKRTTDWLFSRRDGKGGFHRDENNGHDFGSAPKEVADAYITWALAEIGVEGIENELDHSLAIGRTSQDAYKVALAAGALLKSGKQAEGEELLLKLASLKVDGHFDSNGGSITRSGGISRAIETSSLAVLAFLQSDRFQSEANSTMDWIARNRRPDGGSARRKGRCSRSGRSSLIPRNTPRARNPACSRSAGTEKRSPRRHLPRMIAEFSPCGARIQDTSR